MEIRGTSIMVLDLGCGSGAAPTLERELQRVSGVVHVYVNPASETAYVRYDPARIDPWRVAQVIEKAGYRAGRPKPA